MAREVFMHSGISRRRAALQGLCRIALLAALAAAAAAQAASVDAPSPQSALLVYAAASLTDALEEVDAAFTRHPGIPAKASFAASSVLAKQIEAGAPADVFFAAERAWMDYLEQRGLLKRGSRHDLLGNALVGWLLRRTARCG
jgi:molybdate transport system substrate-binding protein